MPLSIDPAWEYWEPDPEIQEAMFAGARVRPFDLLADVREDLKFGAAGIRFGKGNPDRCRFRLRPERDRAYCDDDLPYYRKGWLCARKCQGCQREFQPDRDSRRYCSVECVRSKRESTKPLVRSCEECGREFLAKGKSRRYCGHRCAGIRGTPSSRLSEEDRRNLFEMWNRGDKLSDIASVMGISPAYCKKLRKKLGLAARKSGNHSRSRGRAGSGPSSSQRRTAIVVPNLQLLAMAGRTEAHRGEEK